jgi:hypothetical protein
MDAIHTESYKGMTIKIHTDELAESPRDWDNLGTMCCFHRRYSLGDKHSMTVEEAKELVQRADVISLPLYLYDHSGITMNTTGFSCPWDSGQVGFIYVTKEKVRKEYGKKSVSPKLRAKVLECLRGEVQTYDDFIRGNMYGYVIEDKNGNHVDSCWGFFGDYDGKEYSALKEAQAFVDGMEVKDGSNSEQKVMEGSHA